MMGYEAIPHMATNNDEYDGYHIPKGTVLIGNSWPVRTINLIFFALNFLLF